MLMSLRLFGCLCVFALGVVASHAEQANSDDYIITDRTNYSYCANGDGANRSPARPPYYVLLVCHDFHSRSSILQNKCHNLMQSSYCTVRDCQDAAQRFGTTPRSFDGGSAISHHVCAKVDEYGQWTMMPTPNQAQEIPPEQPHAVPTCNPISLELNAVFTIATTKCDKDFMDTTIGQRVATLTVACYATMAKPEIDKHVKSGQYGFIESAKVNGMKRECEIVDNLQNSISADLRWAK